MEEEIWKKLPGYEYYMVSNYGKIKSFWYNKEKLLKGFLDRGYYKVILYNKQKRKCFLIHQLVAMSFLEHNPNGHNKVIDHINGITTDNRLQNLRIVTSRENTTFGYLKKKTTSKYTGVDLYNKKWRAKIQINNKIIILGRFNTEEEAHQAYQNKLKETKKA